MAKVDIRTIDNLENQPSAIADLNANFQAIQTAVEDTLSRSGVAPNQLQATIDVNEHRLINLPAPIDYTEPARHGDLQVYVDEAEAAQHAAEDARDTTLTYRDEAETAINTLRSIYLGAHATAPTVDGNGDPLTAGDYYLNTGNGVLYYYLNSSWEAIPPAYLSSLLDVDITSTPPTNTQVLGYDSLSHLWKPFTFLAGVKNVKIYLDNDTFTWTDGASSALVIVQAGGGGGGGVGSTSGAGNGGSGAAGETRAGVVTKTTSTVAITVGAAGAGGAVGNNAGGNGGDSSFGSDIVAKGGGGGAGSAGNTDANDGTIPAGGTGGVVIPPTGQPFASATSSSLNASSGSCIFSAPIYFRVWSATSLAFAGASGASSTGRGGGGNAGVRLSGTTTLSGGDGSAGLVLVLEF